MTLPPIQVFDKGFRINPKPCMADMVRWFIAEGYGSNRANHWINEFIRYGLIEKRDDLTYRVASTFAEPSLTESA